MFTFGHIRPETSPCAGNQGGFRLQACSQQNDTELQGNHQFLGLAGLGLACNALAIVRAVHPASFLLLLHSILLYLQIFVESLSCRLLSVLLVVCGYLGVQVGGEKDHAFNRAHYERLLQEHSRYQRYLHIPTAEAP